MLAGSSWRIALAVVCALGAITLMVVALRSQRRRSCAGSALLIVLAGTLLVTGAAPLLISAAQTLTRTPAAPPNVVNRDAPVVAGLTIYAVTDTHATGDTLVALAASTGVIRWSKVFAGDVVYIRARGPLDVIVEASKVGLGGTNVLALRASDGATLWQRALAGGEAGNDQRLLQHVLPLDAAGAASAPIYIATQRPSPPSTQFITAFTALRATDGALVWQATAPASAPLRYSNPMIAGDAALFEFSLYQQDGVAGDMEVVAVDAATGQPRWVAKLHQGPDTTQSDLVADARAAYLATFDDTRQTQQIEALRLTDGALVWRVDVDPTNGMLGLTDAGAVVATTQTAVIALDVASGKTLWTLGHSTGASAGVALRADGTALLVHANMMYFTALAGDTYPLRPAVYAVATDTGKILWTYATPDEGAPVALQWKNGELYLLGGDVGVIALDAATGVVSWRLAETGGLWNPDWTAAPDTLFIGLSVRTPPIPWHICEGGVLYPFMWALSSEDGAVYWRTLIAEGHAYGSTGCA